MRNVRTGVGVAIAVVALVPTAAVAADQKAEELLGQARNAIGAKSLASLQGLAIDGTYQRQVGENQMNGQLTFEVQLPDRFRRGEQIQTPMGPGPTLVAVVNGTDTWRDVENNNTGGGAIVIRQAPTPPGGAEAGGLRNDFQRLMLGLLANTSVLGLDVTYVGKAEADDGTADVLDAKGEGSFAARLFLDTKTHLPLMLTYQGVPPQARMRVMQGGPGPHGGSGPPAPPDPAALANLPRPEPVEMQMFFADHRDVGGLMLPARITIQAAGKPSEEWELKTIKVNAPLKADRFVKTGKN